MKAAVYYRYGDAKELQLADLPIPKPGKRQVLIKVAACGINPKDAKLRRGDGKAAMGTSFPKFTGFDLAGTVAERGPNAARFEIGDDVYGYLDGLRGGTAAEYVVVQEAKLARAPSRIKLEQAAAIPCAYLTALQAIRNVARLQESESICVYGASGGVGTAALQLARLFKVESLAVCSERNLNYCYRQGADEVLDYQKHDVFSLKRVFDCFFQIYLKEGVLYKKAKLILPTSGHFISLDPRPAVLWQAIKCRFLLGPTVHLHWVKADAVDLEWLAEQVDDASLQPHIENIYPLEDIAEAHRKIETGHTRGKLVIKISG